MSPMARAFVCLASALFTVVPAVVRAAQVDDDLGDGTRVTGDLEVTCTPDKKSKDAGAEEFDDTLKLADDRVESKALSARGFPDVLAIPKTVNGVVTLNVTFQKKNNKDKAVYTLRLKKDGAVGGSLTITERGTRQRYTVRSKGAPAVAEKPGAAGGGGKGKAKAGKGRKGSGAGAAAEPDPAVVRVDGGFVRLMTAQVALAEAGVKDDAKKAKVAEILKAAGTDQIGLKGTYLSGAMTAAEYADAAGRRLDEANKALAALLGDDIADLEAAYKKPAAAEFLYHNAMRAALAELDDRSKTAAADKAVHQSMLELALLVRKPAGREADVLAKFRELTDTRVKKALPAPLWARVQKTVEGLMSYEPGQAPPASGS